MDHSFILTIIIFVSVILGVIKYQTLEDEDRGPRKEWPWQSKFIETWNAFINFLLPGLAAYYFFTVRWPLLKNGADANATDFIILGVVILGFFGHLSVMSYNITRGIEAIIDRILVRK